MTKFCILPEKLHKLRFQPSDLLELKKPSLQWKSTNFFSWHPPQLGVELIQTESLGITDMIDPKVVASLNPWLG